MLNNFQKNSVLLLPLLFSQGFLFSTLLLFAFGPISYHLAEPLLFWAYISLYHFAMIIGFAMGIYPVSNSGGKFNPFPKFARGWFWLLLIVAIFAFLIGHKNLSGSDNFLPFDFFENIALGFESSAEQYIARNESNFEYSGNKVLNLLYFFIAFSKITLIVVIVFFWDKLTIVEKLLGVLVTVLSALSGVANGTNSPLFQFVITYASSLVVYFARNYYWHGSFKLKSRAFFVYTIFILFFVAIWFFGNAMLGRGGDVSYLETTSPLGHIRIDNAYRASGEADFLSYIFVWLSNYMVQGYYGFSQSLLADFTTTYGVGNSQFLSRQLTWVFGFDPSLLTFQHKISSVWDETAQWHSLYAQLANDFHFTGVAVWLFLMYFFMARVWKSYIFDANFYAMNLMPLFALMIIFTPANNQVFGFLETLSTFFIMSVLWFKSRRASKLR